MKPSKKNKQRGRQQAQQAQKQQTQQVRRQTPATPPNGANCFHVVALDQLSLAGYHRARVQTLSSYDKIVGGIAWGLSILVPEPKGKLWMFKEDVQGKRKTLADKRNEIAQILGVTQQLDCPFNANPNNFLNVDANMLFEIITWVLHRIESQEGDKNRYECFMSCFNNHYEDNEAAALDFLRSLRRVGENQLSESERHEQFDRGIMRDLSSDGSLIIAEYINYAQTGKATFPFFIPTDDGDVEQAVPPDEFEEFRQKLKKVAVKIDNGLQEHMKIQAMRYYDLVDDLQMAKSIEKLEKRFQNESARYYEMYIEYFPLKEQFEKIELVLASLKTVECDSITEKVKQIISRAEKLREIMLKECNLAHELEQKIQANIDENDNLRIDSVFQKKEADEQRQKQNTLRERDYEAFRMQNNIRRAHDVYSAARKATDAAKLVKEERSEMLSDLDETIDEDINNLLAKIRLYMDDVNERLPSEDKMELVFHKAFIAYASDARNFMTDWLWKARLLKEERLTLYHNLITLKKDIKKTKILMNRVNMENTRLMALNKEFLEHTNTMNDWETELNASQVSTDES